MSDFDLIANIDLAIQQASLLQGSVGYDKVRVYLTDHLKQLKASVDTKKPIKSPLYAYAAGFLSEINPELSDLVVKIAFYYNQQFKLEHPANYNTPLSQFYHEEGFADHRVMDTHRD